MISVVRYQLHPDHSLNQSGGEDLPSLPAPSTPSTMRIFDAGGFYKFVVDSNTALHQGAAQRLIQELGSFLTSRPSHEPVKILDLACGAAPIAVARAISAFPADSFEYHGIDNNEGQVTGA